MSDKTINNVPTFSTVVKQAVENRLKDLHTSMPGIVETFDPVTQTATVQPAIKRIFKTQEEDKEILTPFNLPVLINVPVIFPRGGGFYLTFPVKPGDECLIQWSERSIDNWHQRGGVRKPDDYRLHDLSDAVCFVGLSSLPNVIPSFDNINTQFRDEAGTTNVTITPGGVVEINTVSNTIIDAGANVNITAGGNVSVDAAGNIAMIGDSITLTERGSGNVIGMTGGVLDIDANTEFEGTLTSNGKNISDTHQHSGVQSGGSNTGGVV